ncbi:MAG: FKBP-type peptidyl-prolyl cis-trans isomerase [Gammaproteobacteria bacterium]|nr:FKBP-type peptidyl-prolyl cis-trans isomerase [Gammaproteobacteria bacterium]MCP5200382.1 FKBP-type peptidyl-prolyl cis-trans isomerase [Gammaproteobacteria bacterium]
MKVRLAKGVELLAELPGVGAPATSGARVRYAARLYLRRGEEITTDADLIARDTGYLETRHIAGVELVVHAITLGRRQAMAGIERALDGMRAGGYREVRIAPHLAYGERGLPGRVPPAAVLRVQLWLVRIEGAAD